MGINPGHPAYSLPPAPDDVVRMQKDLQRNLREQEAARSLQSSSMNSGTLTVSGTGSIVVESGGEFSADGTASFQNVVVSGDVTISPGALKVPSVYTSDVTTGTPRDVYVSSVDFQLGYVPSSIRFKQDVVPHSLDLDSLDSAEIVEFKYKDAVEAYGKAAPSILGGIAEQFHEVGLGFAITYDEDGQPHGIETRPLTFALMAKVQDQERRIKILEALVEKMVRER